MAGSSTAGGVGSAFGAIGGALVGGLVGTAAEHATSDTYAYEYIVRKPSGELVSVTQRDASSLAVGQKVLVIAGNQARIVPDYTAPPEAKTAATATEPLLTAPRPAAVTETPLPPPPAMGTTEPLPLVPPPAAITPVPPPTILPPASPD